MWKVNERGEKVFRGGKEDGAGAAQAADKCPNFKLDVEDEIVADELRSCYNCRYRRWTAESFACYKPE